jgi:pyruvate dehydrogenase E2 component (dihydrolipoamide acetyltransferase)
MIDILMPRLSDTMTEGAISAWLKKPGDAVSPGDVLVEIETDKALMEQEAYDAGVLVEILVPEGENVAIGTPIARLDDGGTGAPDATAEAATAAAGDPASVAAALPTEPPVAGPAAVGAAAPAAAPGEAQRASAARTERRRATPLVRRIAQERGIDLDAVAGSGPGGRIVRADLDARAAAAREAEPGIAGSGIAEPGTAAAPATSSPAAAARDDGEPQAVPFDAIRQAIAARLTESAATVPSFTVTASADVDELLALRARINESLAESGTKVSVNDLVVRAVALALRTHPGVNASYSPEGRGQTLLHAGIHVGIAVASPAGLVVPVVRDADRAPVTVIAATSRDLVSRAAERRLTTAEMSGGTFTVSNLGMYGVEHFTAIINPPQGAILAVGAAYDELALDDGEVVVRTRLRYTLSADHRIIDGALAAQFLATLTALLQQPLRILA